MIKTAMPIGRPSSYTREVGERMCARIAVGRSLRTICCDDDMPSVQTALRWLRDIDEFRALYTRAKEESADTLADEIIDLSDTELPVDENGHIDNAAVQQLRLRVEARKWVAAKLKPRKYGDKVMQEHSGPGGAPIQVVTGVPGQASLEMAPTPMLLDSPRVTIDAPMDSD